MKADLGRDILRLKADGGASANNYLLQTQADLTGVQVDRPSCVETTAMGAAYLAGWRLDSGKIRMKSPVTGKQTAAFALGLSKNRETGC